jgi:hypothetical protein
MESEYLKLLLQYNLLPQSERHLSIFEVSGYPHYENVCSNVLAFYFDPLKEHGLGCLLLAALLKLAGQVIGGMPRTVKVNREFPTILGGRLDLLILTDIYAIGIENKIFHHLSNDLLDYKNTIDSSANDQLTSIRIVLSLKPVQIQKDVGFINIVYGDLWHEVRANLGYYAASATQKWITYLIDFMETTELLAGGSMNLTDRDRFFIENEQMVEKLVKDRESFIARLNSQVIALKDIIESSENAPKQFEKRWIYASSCLVHDYLLSGKNVAFDLYVSPKGWVLELFGRNQLSNKYVTQLVIKRRDQITKEEGRFVVARWPLATGLDEIKEKLCEWMTWIIQEDANKSPNTVAEGN